MITQLEKELYRERKLIARLSGIVDELYALLCQRMTEEEIASIEPLITSIQNVAKEKGD